ncbi:MAG: ABC-type transport system, involved in lipoprotein release, permease component [Deltaproteobacteria bacterium]|nr:ABC-type transport system, involved in lipoprotein release, permease component [Deltaproteobacteria bacterium]
MRALDLKLIRDIWHLRGQAVAIALVVACGVATVVTSRVGYESLRESQAGYYAAYRFADVFVALERAPESLRTALAALPGVAAVETRIVAQVTLDVPGLAEPATGRLVSIPAIRAPILNDIHLRRGRWIEPGRPDEVIASEAFADANRLEVGDRLGAVLRGRWQSLRIVGIGISPEYVYEIQGTNLFPDNKRFGVLWMNRDALGPAFDLDGAFNDVSLQLAPGARELDVIDRADRLLDRYGGLGAYGRKDQISHSFLSDEIRQNRVFGTIMPAIFLGVAAFLLHIVLARLVATQREQIAVLKAFGYSSFDVGMHYLELALVCVLAGSVLGALLGLWWASEINRMYGEFYRFPLLRYAPGATVVAIGVGVSGAAAFAGALSAVRRVIALPPAEAMRPESPANFRAGGLERTGLARVLPASLRMIWRNLTRRPARAALSVFGMALAVAILIVGYYFVDAIDYLGTFQFRGVQREDVTVLFHDPRPARTRYELWALPGVSRAEPFRVVPARLRYEHSQRRVVLFGLEAGSELRRILDADGGVVPVPREGAVLTAKLAEILGVKAGDELQIEVLEQGRPVRKVRVAGVANELIGLNAYMDAGALHRLMREGDSISGAFLRVDAAANATLNAELKRMPAVAGATTRLAALRGFEDTLARSLDVFTTVLVTFAAVIAAAMVYNAARIALSERGRELASLRVLGFTRGEVSVLLLGEQAILTALAIPLGFAIGYRLCAVLANAYQWEFFRMPLVVSTRTYGFAVAVVLASALGSALAVRRRIDRLDLVAVLKTRE